MSASAPTREVASTAGLPEHWGNLHNGAPYMLQDRLTDNLLIGFAVLMLTACGSSDTRTPRPVPPPVEAGFDAQQATTNLTAVLGELIKPDNSSAALLLVDLPEEDWLWQQAAGTHGLNGGLSADVHDSFRIASVTKTMTAVATLRLAQRGLLNLDQPIAELLSAELLPPGRALSDLHGTADGSGLTVRQLLRHETGLADYLFDGVTSSLFEAYLTDLMDGRADDIAAAQWAPEELLAFYFDTGLPGLAEPAPGVAHRYSDTNYLLLAFIIEAVTQLDYSTVLRQEVFEPAGMVHSYLETREAPLGMPILPHFLDVDGIGNIDLTASGFNPSADWGGGGVVSNLADLHRFLRALFVEDSLLDAAHKAAMREAVPVADDLPGAQYGLGLEIATTADVAYQGHTGFWGVMAYYLPESGGVLIAVVNQAAIDRVSIDQALFDALREAGW